MATLHFVCPSCMAKDGTFTVEHDADGDIFLRCDRCGSQTYADDMSESVSGVRGRAERRWNNVRKAIRKRNITRNVYYGYSHGFPYYGNLHQFSKNKIHCSCPMCASKTNPSKGGKNWSPSDRRKMAMAKSQVEEYFNSDLMDDLPELSPAMG